MRIIPIPNMFMWSGFLLLISGISRIYDWMFRPRWLYLMYASDFILAMGLGLMLITTILGVYLSLTQPTVEINAGQLLNPILKRMFP